MTPAPLTITASSASMTYGGTPPDHHATYSGFVNGDNAAVAHHPADVLDHGHSLEPGRQLPQLVLGSGRPELHHQLRRPARSGQPGAASPSRPRRVDDLRRHPPAITASYSGFVNGDTRRASPRADVLDHGHGSSPVGSYPTRARARSTPTTPSPTSTARCRSTTAPLVVTASSASMTYGGTPPDHHRRRTRAS